MIRVLFCFITYFILSSTLYAHWVIRFAPLPMESSQKVLNDYKDLINYLENEIDMKVEFVYSTSYEELIDNFLQKKIDVTFLGPLPYAYLLSKDDSSVALAQFLGQGGSAKYTCTLFTRKGVDINLDNLKDKKIGLTQKFSTCGYLFAQTALLKNNSSLSKNKYKYTGSHSNAILSVLLNESEIGSAKTSIVEKYLHLGIKPIVHSDLYPSFVLVANSKTISDQVMQKLTKALSKIKAKKNITKSWNDKFKNGVIDVDYKMYKDMQKLLQEIGYKLDR